MSHQYQPHEQRVIAEKADLDDKVSRLHAFTTSTIFAVLDKEDQRLLRSQLLVMGGYSEILRKRIERFAHASGLTGESEACQ